MRPFRNGALTPKNAERVADKIRDMFIGKRFIIVDSYVSIAKAGHLVTSLDIYQDCGLNADWTAEAIEAGQGKDDPVRVSESKSLTFSAGRHVWTFLARTRTTENGGYLENVSVFSFDHDSMTIVMRDTLEGVSRRFEHVFKLVSD